MDFLESLRPTKLDDLICSDTLRKKLEAILKKPERHHAYLLVGSSGCGKTSFARLFAKHFGVEHDYIEQNSADARGIDDVRELLNIIKAPPLLDDKRIITLDEAHQFTNQAQNALLKGLEDFLPNNYVFLCSTEPGNLIKTIQTRSMLLNFSVNTADKSIRKQLIAYANKVLDNPAFDVDNYIDKYVEYVDSANFSIRTFFLFLLEVKNWLVEYKNAKGLAPTIDDILKRIDTVDYKGIINILTSWKSHKFKPEIWHSAYERLETVTNPESVRIAIINYFRKVLNSEDKERRDFATIVLKKFCNGPTMEGPDGKALLTLVFYSFWEGIDN